MKPFLRNLLTVLVLVTLLLGAAGCDDSDYYYDEETDASSDSSSYDSTGAQGAYQWTVLLYLDADDEVLEQDIFTDLNEAERVGSTDEVALVAQIDRYDGGFDGDGDWTDTRRFYLTQDADLETLNSEEVDNLGEVDMAEAQTLIDFITWATETYPAEHYALILSDHGMGWPGGWFDSDPEDTGDDNLYLAEDYTDGLWLMELDNALSEAQSQAGIEQFDLIGMDACLMGQVDVFTMLANHAAYAVASEEVEPALGWAYADFLMGLAFDPYMDGATLASSIVSAYIERDERITDDTAREELADEVGLRSTSQDEVAQAMMIDTTLTAVDLSGIPDLVSALDNLAYAMSESDQDYIAEARAYAQPFENALDDSLPSPYIDLGNFASILMEMQISDEIDSAAQDVINAIYNMVIAEKHGDDRPGATGITLYFPVYAQYNYADNYEYTTVAAAFTDQSQWDEYLDYYFTNLSPTGEEWDNTDVWSSGDAESGRSGRAGADPLSVGEITLTSDTVALGGALDGHTEITGEDLAYLYIFLGLISDDNTQVSIADIDYLMDDDDAEAGGVNFPAYAGEEVSLDFEFTPTVFALSDGTQLVPALIQPETYDAEAPTYVVEGWYRYAGSGNTYRAELVFSYDVLQSVRVFMSQEGGAPRSIFPQEGDAFIVMNEGFDDQGNTWQAEGGTFIFGSDPVTWEEIDAEPGIYVLGIWAEDFDGNLYEGYATVEVTE